MKKNRTKEVATIQRPPGMYLRGRTWWLTWRLNGVKKSTSLFISDEAEAIRRAVRVLVNPAYQSGDRVLDEMERFLVHKRSHGTYSRHSLEWAVSPIKQFAAFTGNPSIATIKQKQVVAFRLHLLKTLAETSVASYMRALRSFFSWLVEHRDLPASPFHKLELPKPAEAARLRFCSQELRDRLIREAPDWEMKFILLAGMHGGMRKGEIIEARPEWYDQDLRFFAVDQTPTFTPKDRERRSVPLTSRFRSFLSERPLTTPFLLRPEVKQGKAIFRYDFRGSFENYMKAQGCPWVTPHVMRHTFASQYISHGGSLYRLAKYLGDTPETTEKHYGHLVPNQGDIDRGHEGSLTQATLEL